MTEIAPRRRTMAGPRTWTVARELYLSGLTAGEVSERLGVTVFAIRARIQREGWTKTAHAEARLGASVLAAAPAGPAPPSALDEDGAQDGEEEAPDAVALARSVGRRAARALAQGRTAEAAALARTGEQVLAFLKGLPADARKARGDVSELWRADVWSAAVRLADALLKDGNVPALHTRAAFRWRADNLGPEVAAQDRRTAEAGGWAARVYDENGALRPPQSYEAFCAGLRD